MKSFQLFALVAALAVAGAARPCTAQTCSKCALYAYDSTNHRVVELATSGADTVTPVVSLDSSVPLLNSIAWSADGSHLYGVSNGYDGLGQFTGTTVHEINLATGFASTFRSVSLGKRIDNLAATASGDVATSFDDDTSADPGAHATRLVRLGSLQTTDLGAVFGGDVHFGGMTEGNCATFADYYMVRADSWSPLQVFEWLDLSGTGSYSFTQLAPADLPSPVESLAHKDGFLYTVAANGRMYRFPPTPLAQGGAPVTLLGSFPFTVSGLSFRPCAAGPTTTTTTSTTTSTTQTTTTTTTTLPVPLTPAEQACVTTINKDGAKTATTQAAENLSCLVAAQKGSAVSPSTCAVSDSKGKMQKATQKTLADEGRLCAGGAAAHFGYTSGGNANSSASWHQLLLLNDLFGNIDTAFIPAATNPQAAKCQAALLRSANKVTAAALKSFNKCKRTGLADPVSPFASTVDLEICLADLRSALTPSGALKRLLTSVAKLRTKTCATTPLATAVPGLCSTLSDSAFDACIVSTIAGYRVCRTLSSMDGLNVDCNIFEGGLG